MRIFKKTGALLLSILVLSGSVAIAEENVGGAGKTASYSTDYKNLAADCPAATSQAILDINNVRTTLLNGGDMWWNLNDARYEVPKVDPNSGAPSVHSLFAGAIWLGGIDAGGQLKIAAQTYRQSGNDFWPGPLDDLAQVNPTTCQLYDLHWTVYGTDIDDHRAWDFTQSPKDPSTIPADILEWPGYQNPYAVGAGGVSLNVNQQLAPFYDYDDDGVYDPTLGDFPVINSTSDVYADEMIYWVYNDKGNIHTETGGQAIGVQVGALAFAFATSDEINNMTFYRYDILNKANASINRFYMGQWVDADLGCFTNDYVGCDTTLSLGYVYNGTATDPDCATRGYGVSTPIMGVDYFEGPFADLNNGIDDDGDGIIDEGTDGVDNDNDGEIDEADEREKLGMSTFTYYNNDFTITGNPESAVHYYNYMVGYWKDGTPFTKDECSAYGGSVPTTYMFPSDPDGAAFPASWSECSCGNAPADRRWLQASGPFTLEPGARNYITVGAVWVRQSSQAGCAADIDLIRSADLKAQALFDNNFKLVDGPDAPTLVLRELDGEIIISLKNETTSNNYGESYDQLDPVVNALASTNSNITDTTYTFQGYKVYQLKNDQVGADQLDDPTLARLVAQVDIKDGIANIVNKVYDASLCSEVPTLEVEGDNTGIRHSFDITTDLFATGSDNTLVNHKTYYYTAIAYAYNYYDTETYNSIATDCGNVLQVLNEQKLPYLQGRRNYKVYTAIPHIETAAWGGTILNSKYGDSLDVTRLEGAGNGGYDLELTDESVDNILANNGFYGPVVYKGGHAPIDVKIYDPYVVSAQDFTFWMDIDTSKAAVDSATGFVLDTVHWYVVTSPNNDVFESQGDISALNEQLIEKYGISISLSQVVNVGQRDADESLGFIDGRMTFDDNEHPWLTGVADQNTFSYLNWIRSGQYKEAADANPPNYGNFFDDHYVGNPDDTSRGGGQDAWYDANEEFEAIIGGTWAPYCLSTNAINGSLIDGSNTIWTSIYTYGPAFPDTFKYPSWNIGAGSRYMPQPPNTLQNLQSVDLVITADRSKWTRCVVVEVGEDTSFTEGNAFKGHIRQSPSTDKQGSPFVVDAMGIRDSGRAWFPGYAINVETGERLNLMFGEDSELAGENGRDMLWNPTDKVLSPLNRVLFGGRQFIYVMDSKYDEGDSIQAVMQRNFNKFTIFGSQVQLQTYRSHLKDSIYNHIMWVTIPVLNNGYSVDYTADPAIPDGNDVKIELRVRKPYEQFVVDNTNNGLPKYFFSTEGYQADTAQHTAAVDFLQDIKAVPNPYYAYSAYETSQLDNRIKIINLPGTCTVTIYSIDGTLIRQFSRAVGPNTHDGQQTEKSNLDSSIDWDLKNTKNIPISSGVYLIHIDAPGLGEKVIKWFGVLRPADLDTF